MHTDFHLRLSRLGALSSLVATAALASCGPSPNAAGARAHAAFLEAADDELLAALAEDGTAFHVDEEGFTLLHEVVAAELPDLVRAVLDDGHPVNPRTDDGFTPLDVVASRQFQVMFLGDEGDLDALETIAELLIAKGGSGEEWDGFQDSLRESQEHLAAVRREIEQEVAKSLDPAEIERAAYEAMFGR